MADTYAARPSEIAYNAFPEGRRFREMEVYRRVDQASTSGQPTHDQGYTCRMYQDESFWRVRNKKTLVSINPGSRIYKKVMKAIEEYDEQVHR